MKLNTDSSITLNDNIAVYASIRDTNSSGQLESRAGNILYLEFTLAYTNEDGDGPRTSISFRVDDKDITNLIELFKKLI